MFFGFSTPFAFVYGAGSLAPTITNDSLLEKTKSNKSTVGDDSFFEGDDVVALMSANFT